MRTIINDRAHIEESNLKPPFVSPHLDFPEQGCTCKIESRGRKNGAFGKSCLCPLPKRGGFDENGENDEFEF